MVKHMKQHLYAKLFSNPEYMNDFLDGKIYMNAMGYFKELEASEGTKADNLEGISSYLQSENLVIDVGFGGKEIRLTGLVGPVTFENQAYRYLKVFCMYSPELDPNHIDRDMQNIRPTKQMVHDFGEDLVWIYNVREFQKRFEAALSKTGVVKAYARQHVEYYSNGFHGEFDSNNIPFKKHESFSFQKEFRIVLKTDDRTTNPFIVDIGDIRDICSQMKSYEFNGEEFKVEVKRL